MVPSLTMHFMQYIHVMQDGVKAKDRVWLIKQCQSVWFLRLSRAGRGRGLPVVVGRRWSRRLPVASSAIAPPALAV